LAAGELVQLLVQLRQAMDAGDMHAIRAVLLRAVEGYRPEPARLSPGAAAATPLAQRA